MLQILRFLTKNKTLLLFLLLEFIALGLIVNTHSYHQSKFLSWTHWFSGNVHTLSSSVTQYFRLKQVNTTLSQENLELRQKLEQLTTNNNTTLDPINSDSIRIKYRHASVIKNSFLNRNNYLTLNKGTADGINIDMGVITHQGLVGIVISCSTNFSIVLSLLNNKASFNVKLQKTDHFGSLKWNGENFIMAQLHDLPLQANIQVGDTVISGKHSLHFPKNVPVGTIESFTIKNKMYQEVNIKLFEDFSALSNVYIVENRQREEQLKLENNSFE